MKENEKSTTEEIAEGLKEFAKYVKRGGRSMVAIKDMEFPKSCTECEMTHEDRYSCDLCDFTGSNVTYEIRKNLKHSDCPLVEIVTCKDCKYCEEVHYENEGEPPYVKLKCSSTRNTRFYRVEEDFFCGSGKRRE